jgi:hypothetical protein
MKVKPIETLRNYLQGFFSRAGSETLRPRASMFLVVAILVTLIGIVEWKRLPRGPFDSLSYDGFRYLAGACSLLDQGKYLDPAGQAQRTWPPGTSLVYAAAARISGQRPEKLAKSVGLIAYLLIVLAAGATMRSTVRRWPVAALGFAAITLNLAIVSLMNKMWSEPPALAALLWGLHLTIDALDRRSERRMLAAAGLFAVAVLFRFALIATVPLAFLAAAVVSRRLRILIPMLLIPAPMVIVLRALAPHAHAEVPFRISALPLAEDWRGLTAIANQIVPTQLGWFGVILFLALTGAVIWIAGNPRVPRSRRETALFVHFGWIALYAAFLLAAQWMWVSPAPVIDLRMLLPLYPSIVIVLTTGADRLMDGGYRLLSAVTVMALAIAVARSLHPLLQQHSLPAQAAHSCESSIDVAQSIARLEPALNGHVVSNAQGLAWFVLRRPIGKIADATAGSLVLFVDGNRTCLDVIESTESRPQETPFAVDGSVSIARR